jgi:predicted small lipoprotein YifL
MHMKKTMPKTVFKPVSILLACFAYLALMGCGTKGPLYIPEQRYPEGVPKESDKGVNNDATKKDAPEASIDEPSSPTP